MERFLILDKFNTWYDWRLILTALNVTPPEPKTNYIELDGMSGTLDLSEALTGEVTYKDRTLSASFFTEVGTRKDREILIQKIINTLHGKKVKIIEPDDPDHYFYGRVFVKSRNNIVPYAVFSIECICEPWRYTLTDTERRIDVKGYKETSLVINNEGYKTVCPVIEVNGSITITYNDFTTTLTTGSYKISDFKLFQGVNIVVVSGEGSVTFVYKEADL